MGWRTRIAPRGFPDGRLSRAGVQAPGARRRRLAPRPAIRSSSAPSLWCCGIGRFTEDAGICLRRQAACGLIVSIEPASAARSSSQPRPSPESATGTEPATLSGQRGRLVCVLALRDRSSHQVRAGSDVRYVAAGDHATGCDIQNRLSGAGNRRLLSAAFPLQDGTRQPGIGSDCHGAGCAGVCKAPPAFGLASAPAACLCCSSRL